MLMQRSERAGGHASLNVQTHLGRRLTSAWMCMQPRLAGGFRVCMGVAAEHILSVCVCVYVCVCVSQLITQIDNTSAINNFDSILEVSDGIMVSRNHLGLRMTPQKVCKAWAAHPARCPTVCNFAMTEAFRTEDDTTEARMKETAQKLHTRLH